MLSPVVLPSENAGNYLWKSDSHQQCHAYDDIFHDHQLHVDSAAVPVQRQAATSS